MILFSLILDTSLQKIGSQKWGNFSWEIGWLWHPCYGCEIQLFVKRLCQTILALSSMLSWNQICNTRECLVLNSGLLSNILMHKIQNVWHALVNLEFHTRATSSIKVLFYLKNIHFEHWQWIQSKTKYGNHICRIWKRYAEFVFSIIHHF